jgi:hypothetical protein
MTVDDALDYLLELLARPNYFTFTIQNGNRQLLLREPVPGGELEHEPTRLIHLCRAVSLVEAIEANSAERTLAHTGYVDEEGACSRCDETFE